MMSYAERMAATAVTVTSPDHLITGEPTGGSNVTVGFAGGAYRRYREEVLEPQLAALFRLLVAGRQRVGRNGTAPPPARPSSAPPVTACRRRCTGYWEALCAELEGVLGRTSARLDDCGRALGDIVNAM
jgi:hypothetical protein